MDQTVVTVIILTLLFNLVSGPNSGVLFPCPTNCICSNILMFSVNSFDEDIKSSILKPYTIEIRCTLSVTRFSLEDSISLVSSESQIYLRITCILDTEVIIDSVSVLHKIVGLVTTGCRLTYIPKVTLKSVFPALLQLSVTNSEVNKIDCSLISGMPLIRLLDFRNTHVSQIEDCVVNRSSLRKLTIVDSRLTHVSSLALNGLLNSSIAYLRLGGNNIQNLQRFGSWNLIFLSLRNNKLTYIGANIFDGLSYLEHLDLSENLLDFIEDGAFRKLSYLKLLDLSGNHLTSLSYNQSPCGMPFVLNVSKNRLHHPPFTDSYFNLPTFIEIIANDNPIYCDCNVTVFQDFIFESYKSVSHPILRDAHVALGNKYFRAEDYSCDEPSRLKGTNIMEVAFFDDCPIIMGCPMACDCIFIKLRNKTIVNCSGRNLQEMPNSVPNGVIILQLGRNRIKEVKDMSYFNRCDEIYLEYNEITTFSIYLLQNAVVVSLAYNNVSFLAREIVTISNPSLKSLDLRGNTLECSCDSLWIIDWLRNERAIIAKDSIICADNNTVAVNVTDETLGCNIPHHRQTIMILAFLSFVVLGTGCILLKFKNEAKVFICTNFIMARDLRLMKYNAVVLYDDNVKDMNWVNRTFPVCRDDYVDISTFAKITQNHSDDTYIVSDNMPLPRIYCLERDIAGNQLIDEAFDQAANQSRAFFIVVSNNFVNNKQRLLQLETVFHRMLKLGPSKIILFKREDINTSSNEILRVFMNMSQVVDCRDNSSTSVKQSIKCLQLNFKQLCFWWIVHFLRLILFDLIILCAFSIVIYYFIYYVMLFELFILV